MFAGKRWAAPESSIFRGHATDPNTEAPQTRCVRVRGASGAERGIPLQHRAGSSGAWQSVPGEWHVVSLIGPHNEPHKDNRNQDNGEVETQLPAGSLHSQSGSVRTRGRLLRAHRRPPACPHLLTESNKENMGRSMSTPSSKEIETLWKRTVYGLNYVSPKSVC